MTEPALDVSDLNVYYGKARVVFDAALEVRSGETVSVLGRNGAGKTSLIHGLFGVVAADARSIRLAGNELVRLPVYRRVRSGLALVSSGARVFPNLTVHENLEMIHSAGRASTWDIDAVYETFPVLRELRASRGEHLSGGERQLLAIGRALLLNPDVLMLDEPSEGLSPIMVERVGKLIRTLNEHGLAVLLSEQNHHLALSVADRVCFIEKGHIVWRGSSAEAGSDQILGRYLAV
jgi:branched-chain amino acid transport system ATP-binding protein